MAEVLILNLSALPKEFEKVSETAYASDMDTINGRFTNDAPVKYILKYLDSHGKKLDKIICAVTKEAEPAFEKYNETVKNFCNENSYNFPKIEKVESNFASSDMAKTVKEMLDHIGRDDKIYMDTTGGARNSSYLLMFIVRFLEYEGIKLEKAIYSVYDRDHNENNKIEDVTGLYNMFNLINAANTFTSFGNSDELEKIFKNTSNQQIKKTIKAMNRFSDSVMLCKTNLSETLKELNDSLNELNNAEVTGENEILFQRIIDIIRQKFNINDDNPEIDYIDLIKWCISNNLVQQAITIYTEKIPEYLYEKSYFTVSSNVVDEVKKKNSIYSFHYEAFYNGFMKLMSKSKRGATPFSSFIRKADEKIIEALIKSKSIKQFIERLPDIENELTPEIKQGINNFFKVKFAMYDINGRRRDTNIIKQNFAGLSGFDDILKYITANKLDGFIKTLCMNEKVLTIIQGEVSQQNYKYESAKLNTIVYLDEALKETDDYKISPKLTTKKMQQILIDCHYIKEWIRNVVNHAGDENESKEELKLYFEAKGYSVKETLTTNEIKQIILKALENLKMQ